MTQADTNSRTLIPARLQELSRLVKNGAGQQYALSHDCRHLARVQEPPPRGLGNTTIGFVPLEAHFERPGWPRLSSLLFQRHLHSACSADSVEASLLKAVNVPRTSPTQIAEDCLAADSLEACEERRVLEAEIDHPTQRRGYNAQGGLLQACAAAARQCNRLSAILRTLRWDRCNGS